MAEAAKVLLRVATYYVYVRENSRNDLLVFVVLLCMYLIVLNTGDGGDDDDDKMTNDL